MIVNIHFHSQIESSIVSPRIVLWKIHSLIFIQLKRTSPRLRPTSDLQIVRTTDPKLSPEWITSRMPSDAIPWNQSGARIRQRHVFLISAWKRSKGGPQSGEERPPIPTGKYGKLVPFVPVNENRTIKSAGEGGKKVESLWIARKASEIEKNYRETHV